MTPGRYQVVTVGGYDLSEVASAFQKEVRRGNEGLSLFWASEMDLSGYGEYAWKRLRIMVSEDIGLAEPMLPAVIDALYRTWKDLRAKKDQPQPSPRLMLVQAVMMCANAKKSRAVCHASIVTYRSRPKVEMPDYALDKHTRRGRQKGRGFKHFFEEGAKLWPVADIPDPYEAEARRILEGGNADPEPEADPGDGEPLMLL
jgi:replication-associated recombination protein RarA